MLVKLNYFNIQTKTRHCKFVCSLCHFHSSINVYSKHNLVHLIELFLSTFPRKDSQNDKAYFEMFFPTLKNHFVGIYSRQNYTKIWDTTHLDECHLDVWGGCNVRMGTDKFYNSNLNYLYLFSEKPLGPP